MLSFNLVTEFQSVGCLQYESNARFVKWSDGSMQLLLGSEVLDLSVQNATQDHSHLFVRHHKVSPNTLLLSDLLTFWVHFIWSSLYVIACFYIFGFGSGLTFSDCFPQLQQRNHFKGCLIAEHFAIPRSSFKEDEVYAILLDFQITSSTHCVSGLQA